MAAGSAIAITSGRAAAVVVVAAALAAAHAVDVPTASGRRMPVTIAITAGGLLMTSASFPVMAGAGMMGLPIGYVISSRWRGVPLRDLVPVEPAAFLAFVVVASALHELFPHTEEMNGWVHFGVAAAGAAAWFGTDAVIRSATAGSRERLRPRIVLLQGLADWQSFAALVAAGTIFGITQPTIGWWAVPLSAIPYAFSHLALLRAMETLSTYRQTIRALGGIPEAGGFSSPGHADRTAALAVAMGAELGMSSAELERIEQAALLHDIGRLVLNDPAVAGGSYSTRDLAQWSAAIVAEVGHLTPVAAVVADHYRPYRSPGQERDETVTRASQIVKIASAYSVATSGGMSGRDSLEILHRGAAYDYDPELVAVLRRALERRGDGDI
jgi:hypothetical protein